MKKIALFFVIALFFAACNQDDNKVKVVKNYDIEYLTDSEVDQEAGTKEQLDSAMADLQNVTAEAAKDYKLPAKAYVTFRLYINKSGSVDAIKMLMPPKEEAMKDNYNVIDNDKIVNKFAAIAENWEFTPATVNGEAVNFRRDIYSVVFIDADGSVHYDLLGMGGTRKPPVKGFHNSNEYFIAVEQMPTPIGGLDSLQAKIEYPELAKRAGIEGRVFIKAYLDEKGNVVDADIIKGIGAGCDEAALEAVKQTKFSPGMQRGKPVKVQVSIPIVFKLQ